LVDPTLLAICRPCRHDVVDVIPFRIEDDGQQPACAGRPEHQESAGVPLMDKMLAVADLLHLFRDNLMASHVGHIPRIPDEAADIEHTDTS